MRRVFDFLIHLYPAGYRAEFEEEMRSVFLSSTAGLAGGECSPATRSPALLWRECFGLVVGAAREWCGLAQTVASMAAGLLCAGWAQLLLYRYLVRHLAIVCLLAGLARSQPAKLDPAALETARSIYVSSFTALREAKTIEDMRKLSVTLAAPGWMSVDRFGRSVPHENLDAELEELLKLPPETRVTGMDIIWAETDAERLIAVAWMMPSVTERIDAEGAYGPKGETHRLTRGTLIRDIFEKTDTGWRRIRHDKLMPNDTVLAVDGKPLIVPPVDDRGRITFGK
jgi:hypothetical protein